MAEELSPPRSALITTPLDAARDIVAAAQKIAEEELKRLKEQNHGTIPGESPAWNIAWAADRELGRVEDLQKAAKDTVMFRRDELEQAFAPLVAFKCILTSAGESSTDVDSGDVANVMNALLMNSYQLIDAPQCMRMGINGRPT